MKDVLVVHPGTQHAHALVSQLQRVHLLGRFITGIGFAHSNRLIKFLSGTFLPQLSNRILDSSVPAEKITSYPYPELRTLYQLKRRGDTERIMFERNKTFQNALSDKRLFSAGSIIGFDTSSWIIARKAKQQSIPFILDQSIAHPLEKTKVYQLLNECYPQWSEDIPQKPSWLTEMEAEEHELATRIVVASTFSKTSLIKNGVSENKIIVNPYGVSSSFFISRTKEKPDRKIRFLYLGFLGARKGLPLLLDVWNNNQLSHQAELWLAGPASSFALRQTTNTPGVNYLGLLPRTQLPEILAQCDCLVFPSYFEGFGQVILEAMAAGLPVITTEATAGPDIIENEYDGFLFRSGNQDELARYMVKIANDPLFCREMGKRARKRMGNFSWDSYGDRWRDTILSLNKL